MSDKPKVWMNNKIIDWEEARVSVVSHGLSRGSAIFEAFGTHEVPGGVAAFRMDAHLKRMERTLALLEMRSAYPMEALAKAVAQISEINQVKRGLVKILGFWGQEAIINLVLDAPLDMAIYTIPATHEGLRIDDATPLTACLSKWNKPDPGAIPVQAKACANYLPGYLIRKDANERGFDVGVTLTASGNVAEGSIESLFVVKDGIMKTAPLDNILASVTRDSIITAGRAHGMDIREVSMTKEYLFTADELFTCHTGNKVTPICKFEDRELPAPGPFTEQISDILKKIVASEDPRFSNWMQTLYTL